MSFELACPIPVPETERVLLAHGSGGLLTAQLIEQLVLPAFRNPALEPLDDQAVLSIDEMAELAGVDSTGRTDE